MKDIVVTVRMPLGLIRSVEQKVAEGQFLDFSEAIRSYIRQRYLESTSLAAVTNNGTIKKNTNQTEGSS